MFVITTVRVHGEFLFPVVNITTNWKSMRWASVYQT